MRIGKLESSILCLLGEYHERIKKDQISKLRLDYSPVEWGHGYQRYNVGSHWIPALWIRDQVFSADSKSITTTQKSSFSRAIKNLKKNALIEPWNHFSSKENYVTHIKLTDQGKLVLERIKQKQVKNPPNVNDYAMVGKLTFR